MNTKHSPLNSLSTSKLLGISNGIVKNLVKGEEILRLYKRRNTSRITSRTCKVSLCTEMGVLHALITITTVLSGLGDVADSLECGSQMYAIGMFGERPFQADIYQGNMHVCGGSIISEKWTLTASHCFNNSSNPQDMLLILSSCARKPYRYANKRSINLNSKDEGTASVGDIALLKLASAVTFLKYIMPICLQSCSVTVSCGMECWVTERGRTSSKGPPPANGMLQKIMVQFTDYKKCDRKHHIDDAKNAKIVIIQDEKKCAGNKHGQKDSCVGDSGETVVCKVQDSWYQIGVASRGEGCPANRSEAYTLVTSDQDCNNVTDTPSPTKICGGGNNRTNCASSNKTGDSPSKHTRGDVRLSVQENGGTTEHHHYHWMILGPVTLLLLNM